MAGSAFRRHVVLIMRSFLMCFRLSADFIQTCGTDGLEQLLPFTCISVSSNTIKCYCMETEIFTWKNNQAYNLNNK